MLFYRRLCCLSVTFSFHPNYIKYIVSCSKVTFRFFIDAFLIVRFFSFGSRLLCMLVVMFSVSFIRLMRSQDTFWMFSVSFIRLIRSRDTFWNAKVYVLNASYCSYFKCTRQKTIKLALHALLKTQNLFTLFLSLLCLWLFIKCNSILMTLYVF